MTSWQACRRMLPVPDMSIAALGLVFSTPISVVPLVDELPIVYVNLPFTQIPLTSTYGSVLSRPVALKSKYAVGSYLQLTFDADCLTISSSEIFTGVVTGSEWPLTCK